MLRKDRSISAWSGFHETQVDYHLRCYDIKILIAVGFSQRSCLYQTSTGAVEHNYRVIMLRNFEHMVGYTSTSSEFVKACEEYKEE
jgi:hypothetical protein